MLVAKQRWRYAIFALEGGAEVALVFVTQMIADGGKVVGRLIGMWAVFDGNVPSSWSVGGRMVVEARQDKVINHQLSHCISVG